MAIMLNKLYMIMDKGPLRALCLILSILLAVCVFRDPTAFAAKTSSLAIWQSLLIIWAVCSGIIYGVGFKPMKLFWQTFFSPLLAMMVIVIALYYYYF